MAPTGILLKAGKLSYNKKKVRVTAKSERDLGYKKRIKKDKTQARVNSSLCVHCSYASERLSLTLKATDLICH